MLTVNNISYYIGSRALYKDVSLHIKPKDRIGLIGANGTGKSTLLKLINGEYMPDGGEISRPNSCTLAFLNQDLLSYLTDETILDVAMQAFSEAIEIQKRIDETIEEMEKNYSDALLNRLTRYQEDFDRLGGYDMKSKAEAILEGLGFVTADLQRPLKEFSGGWRMRVMLAKMLLQRPSVLMLDEPSNHLDLPSIQWLEQYLRSYEGAIILVSHDREFLNNVVNCIVEVRNQKLNLYSGDYAYYLEERELREEIQQNAFENQQQMIRQTERFIERFRSKATKARQVQSRVKALDRIDVIEEVRGDAAGMNIRFKPSVVPGKKILELKKVGKSYGDKMIFTNSFAQINRGDKIALIGANGKGKSTLLRVISGTESFEGERIPGHNVIESFYAQHQLEALNVENEILAEMLQAGSDKTEQELRNVLGCFLFSGEDVYKKIKVLSGGEKSRVALAKTLISNANFLLLDEPTNHLDMLSVNLLIHALQQYDGTLVTVSHDRHFITHTATTIWYIEDYTIKEYPGTYEEFRVWEKEREAERKLAASAPSAKKEAKLEKEKKQQRTLSETQALEKELKKLQKQLEMLEIDIETLEGKITSGESEMAKPDIYSNPKKLSEATAAYDSAKKMLADKQSEWESLAMKIDEMTNL